MTGKDWTGHGPAGRGPAGRGSLAGIPLAGVLLAGTRAAPKPDCGGRWTQVWPRRHDPFSDLERIAIQFANELRAAAKQTGNLGERSLNDLRDILTDTLAKVRDEVFSEAGPGGKASDTKGEPGHHTTSGNHSKPTGSAPQGSGADDAGQPGNASSQTSETK